VINDNAKPETAVGLAAGYGSAAGRLWTTLPKVLISHAVISISLVPIAVDADVKKDVASWLDMYRRFLLCRGRSLDDYVEVWCMIHHLLSTCHVYTEKVLGTRVLLPSF
jgi:hypothetical protein